MGHILVLVWKDRPRGRHRRATEVVSTFWSLFGKTAPEAATEEQQKWLSTFWSLFGKTAQASQMTGTEGNTMTADQEQALEDLEVAMCGEAGLGGAFVAAFQQELPEEIECPAYDAYIWSFVAEDPLSMCLMDPAHLRVGVECVREYMEETPMPALYALTSEIMQYVESDLNGAEMPAQQKLLTSYMRDMPPQQRPLFTTLAIAAATGAATATGGSVANAVWSWFG